MTDAQQALLGDEIGREVWACVRDLIHEVNKDEKRNEFAKNFFQWDLAVKQFRKVEERRIILGSPTDRDLASHSRCLHALLEIGNALLINSKLFAAAELEPLGIRHGDLAAYVEELEQSHREWNHGFNDKEIKAAKESIFGAEAGLHR